MSRIYEPLGRGDYNLGNSGAIRNTLGRFSYEKTPEGRLIARDNLCIALTLYFFLLLCCFYP